MKIKNSNYIVLVLNLISCILMVAVVNPANALQKRLPAKIVKKEAPVVGNLDDLKASDLQYQKSKAIKFELTKKVKYALLGKEKENKGLLFVSGKNLRLELEPPQKSLVVINNGLTWLISYLGDEKDADIQVTKLKTQTKVADKGNSTLFALLGQGGILKHFDAKSSVSNGETVEFELIPKQTISEVQKVKLALNKKSKQIQGVTYWDELENETSFVFSKQELNAKINPSLFKYVPPKNAVVTEQ
jgi:outer membrane lipoprotein-sorting protein